MTSVSRGTGQGNKYYGKTIVPKGLSQVVAIAAGDQFSVALKKDGSLVHWGDTSYVKPSILDTLKGIVDITAGNDFLLGRRADGTVVAVGNVSSSGRDCVNSLKRIAAFGANAYIGYALDSLNRFYCWQIQSPWSSSWLVKDSTSGFVDASCDLDHCVGVLPNGSIRAWMLKTQSNTADSAAASVPTGMKNVKKVVAGFKHYIALKNDSTLVAWGENSSGQISNLSNQRGIADVVASGIATVTLSGNGQTACQGGAYMGYLPCDGESQHWGVTAIALNLEHALYLTQDSLVEVSGSNRNHQLYVNSWQRVQSIAAGRYMSAAVSADSLIKVTGLGVAVPLSGELIWKKKVLKVFANYQTLVALTADSSLYMAGDAVYFKEALAHVSQVAVGDAFVLALTTDGSLHCGGECTFLPGSVPKLSRIDASGSVAIGVFDRTPTTVGIESRKVLPLELPSGSYPASLHGIRGEVLWRGFASWNGKNWATPYEGRGAWILRTQTPFGTRSVGYYRVR